MHLHSRQRRKISRLARKILQPLRFLSFRLHERPRKVKPVYAAFPARNRITRQILPTTRQHLPSSRAQHSIAHKQQAERHRAPATSAALATPGHTP
jgi:hypothetical protein